MKGNVIVTGATSFIGRHLITELIGMDYKVYAINRVNSKNINLLPQSSNLINIFLDMEDYDKLSSLIPDKCDILFALAWNGTRGEDRSNFPMQQRNYENSILSVNEAIKLGCKVIISAGSQAEYGNINGKIYETTECRPNTEYGKFKLKFYNDTIELCQKKGIHFKEPRFFSLYGKDDYEGTMIISMIKNMLLNKRCELTECIQLWDFLYITDAIKGLIYLAEKDCIDGAYNFGSGDTRKLREFIIEMYKATNSKSELLFGQVPYPDTGMVSIYPCIEKLNIETGWRPNISFEEGIKIVVEYIKNMK